MTTATSQPQVTETQEATKRYAFVVITGRYKIFDHQEGCQIATANDEDSARMLVGAANDADSFRSGPRTRSRRGGRG